MSEASRKRTREAAAGPRLPLRQRSLLALLRALGGQVGERDFQKFLFLYALHCRQSGATPPYEFVPHSQGAFSFTAVADREKLVRRQILVDGEGWHLTPDGNQIAARFANRSTTIFALRNRELTGDALVAETYRRSPYHASRSKILHRVLGDDPATRNLIAKERSVRAARPLITIGYERRSYEDYFNELLRRRVNRLCDVRGNPVSRKWGFSKRTLSDGCRQLGIKYQSLPELGIASERRADLNGAPDYDRPVRRLRSHHPQDGDWHPRPHTCLDQGGTPRGGHLLRTGLPRVPSIPRGECHSGPIIPSPPAEAPLAP